MASMNYILSDGNNRENLLPLTFTRPVADIRIGILTIREKWEYFLKTKTSSLTADYLQKKFPLKEENDNVVINGGIVPSANLIQEINRLHSGEQLIFEETVIAKRVGVADLKNPESDQKLKTIQTRVPLVAIENTWDIFSKNDEAIKNDFVLLTAGKNSQPISPTNFVRGNPAQIFIEEGATVEFAFLNSESGPIYIGKDAEVMEGCKIRGPFALCEHATLKMDAKVYGATTIGPHCKVGGEINNSVIFGFSNKAHDGFLGNAVLGEWVNIGADTNNSNLKNTYDYVKLWSYSKEKFVNTGLQFCGLIMGDHSKCGINTMFNTGTVVGASCNLFGSGFQRNFIPSFSWGGPLKMTSFDLNKSFEVATAVMARRGITFDETEKEIMTYLYNASSHRR